MAALFAMHVFMRKNFTVGYCQRPQFRAAAKQAWRTAAGG